MTDDTVTLGEIARRLGRIESRLDSAPFVVREVYDLAFRGVENRLAALEESRRWVARTVAGSVLASVGSLIVALLIRTTS